MTSKNNFFAVKAALLDPACQDYKIGQFDITVPPGETWYAFNAWFCRFDYNPANPEPGSGHPWFQRNLGVERYTILPAGTQIIGTQQYSFLLYARPSQVIANDPTRYADAESLYYDRMTRYKDLPFFKKAVIIPGNTVPSVPAEVYLPTDMPNGFLITNITVHGGCWVTLNGGTNLSNATFINTREEINDAHEVRFTAGHDGLQPIKPGIFNRLRLGLGSKSDVVGACNSEASWGGISGFKLPADW